ncbi:MULTISPECIES: M48 family metallopeptidase [unclassified Schlesneria]|uniref:M48 family metallopeptidase n=1 Tax=Schlesneria TaxID=656899 RepID=UPI00359F90E9
MSFHQRIITRRTMIASSLAVWCCGCRHAPITGRGQLLAIPETQEVSMGLSAYEEVVKKESLSTNQQYIDMVNRVGHRIAQISDRPDYEWEFKVLATPEQNAFCLPGGKVAIHEGILPICENEAGLAVVMSHEIGHALARHGGERMTQNYVVQGGQMLLSYATKNQDEKRQQMIQQAYGVGTQYGAVLPFSRKQELEADHIGVMLMSKAGYDPSEAPQFWSRFAASHKGQQPSEFMSTHPSDERREQALVKLLPEARELYAGAGEKIGIGESISVTQMAAHQEDAELKSLPVSGASASKSLTPANDDWR